MPINYAEQTYVFTAPVALDYPKLFTPVAFKDKATGKEKGEKKYQANFLVPRDHPDYQPVIALANKVFRGTWPDKPIAPEWFPCFANGDELADKAKLRNKDNERMRGCLVIQARSIQQPSLSVYENKKLLKLLSPELIEMNKSKFYAGVLCYPTILFNAFEVGKTGINAYLNMLLSTNRGERFAVGRDEDTVYAHVTGGPSNVDPTAPKEEAGVNW